MDYAMPGKRKSKNDKKAKARYNRFKRGGSSGFRTGDVELRASEKSSKVKKKKTEKKVKGKKK